MLTYAASAEQALQADRMFLVGDDVTLADICFVAELPVSFRTSVPAIRRWNRAGWNPF